MTGATIRRILLVAATVAVVVATGGAAGAHEEGWASSRWRTERGTRFTEPPAVAFTFTHEGATTQPGIEQVELSVAPAGEVTAACVPPAPEPLTVDPRREDADSLDAVVPLTLPCNGRFTVTAVATTGAAEPLHPAESSPPLRLEVEAAVPPPPPTDVGVERGEGGGGTAVRVTWQPPAFPPPDLVGYQVARSREADTGFEVVGESVEPEFLDGEVAEGGVFHYRVHSVRLGAADELLASAASPAASVELPAATTTTTTSASPGTTASPAAPPTGDASGFGSLQQQAARLRPGSPPPPATIRPTPATTVDAGFQQTLPFDPDDAAAGPATSAAPVGPVEDVAAGGTSQIFEEGDESDRKAVLAPVAGAAALLVVSLQLRWLLRQAAPVQ